MLILTDDLYVGNGRHKKCFIHPNDKSKCIKMAYTEDGKKDLERELSYLKILKKSGMDYSVLPQYFGEIDTNLGKGYVYELIVDDDGSLCKTLQDYLDDEASFIENFDILAAKLKDLKDNLLKNRIITMGLFPENIIVRRGGTAIFR